MFKIFDQYRGLNRDIYILFIGRIVSAMGTFIWPMMTLILSAKMGYDAPTIALFMFVALMINLPAFMLGGKLADKYGRKNVILISSYLMVSGYFINAFLPLGIHTLILFVLSAFFGNIQHPASSALIADRSSSDDRQRAYSLSYLGFNLGFILGPSIGGFLFQNHLGLAFFIDGFTTLIGTILIHIYVNDQHIAETIVIGEYEEGQGHISLVDLLKGNKVLWFYLFIVAFGEVMYMQANFLLPLQLESLMETYSEYYGLLSSFNGLIVIIFTPLLTLWLKNTLEIHRLRLGILSYMFAFALYALFYRYTIIFIIGMFIFTIGEILGAITRSAYITRRIPQTHRARFDGTLGIITNISVGLFQILFSFTLNFLSHSQAWYIILSIGLLTLILFPLFLRWDQNRYPKLYGES